MTHNARIRRVRDYIPYKVACALFCFVTQICLVSAQQDNKGLFPPANLDHSRRMAAVRELMAANRLSEAQTQIQQLIADEPANFEGYFWLSVIQLQNDENHDAVRSLRHAEVIDANPYVLKLLAYSYYKLHQFHLFELTMNQALAKQPEDFAPYYYLGRYYEDKITDFSKAIGYFQQSLARNPHHPQSVFYLGYCLESQHKTEEAERQYQTAMKVAENSGTPFAAPYQQMARLRLSFNMPAEALVYAQHAVAIAPNDPMSHKVLAEAYTDLKRQSDALAEWQQTAKLDPTDATPYYHLYRIYLGLKEQEQANSARVQFNRLSSTYQ